MPRPKNKKDLLELAEKNYAALMELIESLSPEEQESSFPSGTLNRNIRDVIMHLYHWHMLLLNWYTVGMKGAKPPMPAEGYSWKMTPELNRMIQKKYRDKPLGEAKELFEASHHHVMDIINHHSDQELFQKKRYTWTGSTSLGQYLVSATSSHYEWARKLIKKAKGL